MNDVICSVYVCAGSVATWFILPFLGGKLDSVRARFLEESTELFFHSFLLMEIPECPGVKCPIGTTCVEEPKECLTAPCAQYSCQIKQGMLLLFSPTHPRTRYHLPLVTSWFFSGLKVSSINYRELILFLLVNPRC